MKFILFFLVFYVCGSHAGLIGKVNSVRSVSGGVLGSHVSITVTTDATTPISGCDPTTSSFLIKNEAVAWRAEVAGWFPDPTQDSAGYLEIAAPAALAQYNSFISIAIAAQLAGQDVELTCDYNDQRTIKSISLI